ncbi:MAG: hypothetical protein EZS28_044913, partial [Streblomastix strix]
TTTDDSISQSGGTIEATIGGISGQLSIQNTNFIKCISQQSYQSGAINLIIKDQRIVSISQTSFIQCESDQGSGINAQILSGSVLTMQGTCTFIYCKARLDLGAALYSTISGTDSKLIIVDEIQFEGYLKDLEGNKQIDLGQGRGAYIELLDNGIIEANEILFNECKGVNGGGIQINSLSSQKQQIKRIQLTDCIGTGNGGGLYCIIGSGEIEMNEFTINGCSGLNGGGIYTSIEQSGKFTINESCSISNCQSTSTGSGGGIYAIINSGQIEMNQVTMNECSGLNGGGIYTQIDGTSKLTIKDSCSLTKCQSTSTGSGGGIYAIISSGQIELNQVIMNECSGLNGGGIYTSIEQSGKLTIKDSSSFTKCQSSDGNGGGIYAIINSGQIEMNQVTMNECSGLNGGGIYTQIDGTSKFTIKDSRYNF